MAGPFDPFGNASVIQSLIELVKSPRVQGMGRSLNRASTMGNQPLRFPFTGSGASSQNRQPGATPITGIGQAFGRGIGSALTQAMGQQQPSDPLMDLYNQLVSQLQSPVSMPTGIDKDDLMAQVQKAINPIYDQRIDAAEKSSSRSRGEVRDMYRALSNDYERLAPQQVAQAKAAQQEVEQLYGQLRSNITGDYARVSKEQAELFESLGIEDALPSVLDDQDDAVNEAAQAASELGTQQQQRYMDQGQIDSTYYREGSPLATMTGNEINVDLLNQLEEYVNQANAERSAGIQSGYLDQLNQAQGQLAQQQQGAQSESARRQEMLWQMLQGQMNARNQPAQAPTVDSFMGGLPPQVQQAVAGAFTRLQRSPEAVYGKVEDKRNPVPGSFVETTPQWYMAQADQMLQRGEIDPTTYQALQMYMQLYFGTGK
jgi:hypothetical protein